MIRAKYSSPGSTSDDTDAGPSYMMDDHVPHVIAIEEEDDMQEGHLVGHSGEGMSHRPQVLHQGRVEFCLDFFDV